MQTDETMVEGFAAAMAVLLGQALTAPASSEKRKNAYDALRAVEEAIAVSHGRDTANAAYDRANVLCEDAQQADLIDFINHFCD